MTRVKFCGFREPEEIRNANLLRPDYLGFVFYKKSKRYITAEKARALRRELLPEIPAVGVFVNEDIPKIGKLYQAGSIQLAQLHGTEGESYIRELRQHCPGLGIIQSFLINTADDLKAAKKSRADFVLLDSGMGSGESFDWGLLKDFPREYFLAGGLWAGNVREAIRNLHPFAVDVSSGIEGEQGKDVESMRRFINEVRCEDSLVSKR